jgi:hypothetical protein
MSKGRLGGWNLNDDKNWKERLDQIKNNRPGSSTASPSAPAPVTPPSDTLRLPTYVCDPWCPICKGETFYIDSQEHAIACPNARKVSGGD